MYFFYAEGRLELVGEAAEKERMNRPALEKEALESKLRMLLDLAESKHPQIAFLDIRMPGLAASPQPCRPEKRARLRPFSAFISHTLIACAMPYSNVAVTSPNVEKLAV